MDPMTAEEIRTMVGGSWFGHLALADGGRAYSLPIYFGHREGVFYFHSLPGHKDDYFETTEEACLTITRAESEDRWASVIALGPIEVITMAREQKRAMDALMGVPLPPALGDTKQGEPAHGGHPLVFRKLTVREITGRKSVPAPARATTETGGV